MDPCFNPRPRAGGDSAHATVISLDSLVSIHAPAQGATSADDTDQRISCFNPRPRAGGDLHRNGRATADHSVSIHAPAQGATSGLSRCPGRLTGFNPRPRAGGDMMLRCSR